MSQHSIPRDWAERCGRISCRMAGWIHPPVSPSILRGTGEGGAGELGGRADSRHQAKAQFLSSSLLGW